MCCKFLRGGISVFDGREKKRKICAFMEIQIHDKHKLNFVYVRKFFPYKKLAQGILWRPSG